MTLAVLFGVGIIFVGVYMFIKITSWVGYKSQRGVSHVEL